MIDRRILVNYKVEPEVIKRLLPAGMEPLVINGYASAGICLLRLKDMGMRYAPRFLRVTSENAAHRFLVRYVHQGREVRGVYIPRRDTDSFLNIAVAGKIFSWPYYPAHFEVSEEKGLYDVKMQSKDGKIHVHVCAERANVFPGTSMFESLEEASNCFRRCSVGVSPSTRLHRLKMIELKTKTWNVTPLNLFLLQSSYFDDRSIFPQGDIFFDSALLMEGVEHEWESYAV